MIFKSEHVNNLRQDHGEHVYHWRRRDPEWVAGFAEWSADLNRKWEASRRGYRVDRPHMTREELAARAEATSRKKANDQ